VNNVLTGTRQRTRRVYHKFTRSGARTVRSVDDPLTLADRWQLAVVEQLIRLTGGLTLLLLIYSLDVKRLSVVDMRWM